MVYNDLLQAKGTNSTSIDEDNSTLMYASQIVAHPAVDGTILDANLTHAKGTDVPSIDAEIT